MSDIEPLGSSPNAFKRAEEGNVDSDDIETHSHTLSEQAAGHDIPLWLVERLSTQTHCNYCQDFVDAWTKILSGEPLTEFGVTGIAFPHHKTTAGLEASAVHGCKICWQFYHHLKESGRDGPFRGRGPEHPSLLDIMSRSEREGVKYLGFLAVYPTQRGKSIAATDNLEGDAEREDEAPFIKWNEWNMNLQSSNSMPRDRNFRLVLSAVTFPEVNVNREPMRKYGRLTENYSSSLLLAKDWLRCCSVSHPACNCESVAPPSRLLHIDTTGVRLALRGDHYDHPSYATLSHRWGQLAITKLTKSTLGEFQKLIWHDKLCKTFKEAIFVARELGFEYIWIDSLCIVQDDEDDWNREAPLMASVYGGSSLNIAATGAFDGNGGLFLDRISAEFRREQALLMVQVKDRAQLFRISDPTIYSRCVDTQPLSDRAWTLQERILAPRTLHFTQTELFWECRSNSACDSFPDELPREFYLRSPLKKCVSSLSKEARLQYTPLSWSSIVAAYTAGRLTFSKDKLVAISGIAKYFQQQRPISGNYLAGLWRNNLERSLCWTATFLSLRAESYRAPTWSWASVNGQISIPNEYVNEDTLYVEVLEASTTTLIESPFGEVTDGFLKIRCKYLLRGRMIRHYLFGLKSGETDGVLNLDSDDYLLGNNQNFSDTFYFLPILKKNDLDPLIEGILLQTIRESPKGYYKRIGYLSTSDKANDRQSTIDIIEQDMSLIESNGGVDEDLYLESTTDDNGETCYVVVIV